MNTMQEHKLYDDALSIVDRLLTDEDDFERASMLNQIIVELAVLKHTKDHAPKRLKTLVETIAHL